MPVSIGGCVIEPGMIVAGDKGGVVAFHPHRAPNVLAHVSAQLVREQETMQAIRNGVYRSAFSAPSV